MDDKPSSVPPAPDPGAPPPAPAPEGPPAPENKPLLQVPAPPAPPAGKPVLPRLPLKGPMAPPAPPKMAVPRPPRPAGPPLPPGVSAEKFDKKALFKIAFIGAASVLALWGVLKLVGHFTKKSDKDVKDRSADTMAVNVLEAKLDRFQDTLVAVGTIAGGSEIPLRFETEGVIDHFEFREGDKVRKGDLIARISQRDVYLKLKKAELELDQYEKLYAIGGVARGRLEEARVQADLARSELEKTMLRAHRDGIVGDKDAEVGEYVTPSKRVATLVNIETCMVRVGIIEKEIDKIFPGQKVVLTVDAYAGVEFTGRVETISPIGQGNSKTFTVDARLDNEGGLLLPGMFARTRITIFEEDNTISVPNDAVEKTQAGARIFVVTKENKAQARDIEPGYVSSQFTQVNKGLEPGELVITQKPQDLKDGQAVKVIEVQK